MVIAIVPLVLLATITRSINPVVLAEIIVFEAVWAMGAAAMLWTGSVTPTATFDQFSANSRASIS